MITPRVSNKTAICAQALIAVLTMPMRGYAFVTLKLVRQVYYCMESDFRNPGSIFIEKCLRYLLKLLLRHIGLFRSGGKYQLLSKKIASILLLLQHKMNFRR